MTLLPTPKPLPSKSPNTRSASEPSSLDCRDKKLEQMDEHHKINLFEDGKAKNCSTEGSCFFFFFECY